jgi:cell division protein FtsL
MSSRINSNEVQQLKPFLSVLFIIGTLLGIVFIKMEERRLSYALLKMTQEHKKTIEIQKQKETSLAKLTRPQLLENVATKKLTLRRVTASQIIHLSASDTVTKTDTRITR